VQKTTPNTSPRSAATAGVIPVVLGVVAYITGITKRWVLDPVGDAFGEQTPDTKVLIVVALVLVTTAALFWRRNRRIARVRSSSNAVSDRLQRAADAIHASPDGRST
jgi:hypothetical protein